MAEEYSKQFLVPCVPVMPSLPADLARPPASARNRDGVVRIGFAGQIYASEEWKRLLFMLDSMNWRLEDSRFELHAFTKFLGDTKPRQGRLFHREWLPYTSELIEALAKMDLQFLPYRFAESHAEEARLCFPSKLTTYLAVGVPVLLHGPSYSSPVRFAASGHAAFLCDSPSSDMLRGVLTCALRDSEDYAAVARNGRAVFDRHLTHDVLARSIREVLTTGPNVRRTAGHIA